MVDIYKGKKFVNKAGSIVEVINVSPEGKIELIDIYTKEIHVLSINTFVSEYSEV